MKILTDLNQMKKEKDPVCLAAGFFDGIHKGHRKILDLTIEKARRVGGKAWILTFDTHPLRILKPSIAPALLTSNEHKLKILGETALHGCLLLPFTRRLARTVPEEFIDLLCGSIPALRDIVVGRNWHFGAGGKGNISVLSKLCRKHGIKMTAVNPVVMGGEPISSTRIRTKILHGRLVDAAAMLGRPFSIYGTVEKGKSMARGLGFPTANLKPSNEVLPPFGVYAVLVYTGRKTYDGVLNFGTRPTFSWGKKAQPQVEIHLLDFDGELYGIQLEVLFVERLRDERRFTSKEDLIKQIRLDIRLARALLGHPEKKGKE